MNNKIKNVLYVTYDGLSDPVSQSQILPYLEKLSNNAIKFHILSFEKKEKLPKLEDELWSKVEKYNWVWYPDDYTKKPAILSALYDIDRGREKIKKILKYNPEILCIHARSYISMMMAYPAAKRYNIPIIFDMRGFWADERVDGHIWSLKNPIYRIVYKYFKRKEKLWLKNSDAIVVLTDAAKDFIIDKFSIASNKIYVIPCATDFDFFDPDKVEIKYDNHIFNLLYFGSAENWYLFDEMFEFYNEYRRVFIPSKFTLILHSKNNKILELLNKYKWYNEVEIIYNIPRASMPKYINQAMHVVFFLNQNFSNIGSSPIKNAEALAMGKPIITNTSSEAIVTLEEKKLGVFVKNHNKKEYRSACLKLKNTDFDSQYIRAMAREKYDLTLLSSKYIDVYDAI